MSQATPKDIIRDLAEKALNEKYFYGRQITRKPGEMIQNLGPVKRQVLKNLKPEDMEKDRWPR